MELDKLKYFILSEESFSISFSRLNRNTNSFFRYNNYYPLINAFVGGRVRKGIKFFDEIPEMVNLPDRLKSSRKIPISRLVKIPYNEICENYSLIGKVSLFIFRGSYYLHNLEDEKVYLLGALAFHEEWVDYVKYVDIEDFDLSIFTFFISNFTIIKKNLLLSLKLKDVDLLPNHVKQIDNVSLAINKMMINHSIYMQSRGINIVQDYSYLEGFSTPLDPVYTSISFFDKIASDYKKNFLYLYTDLSPETPESQLCGFRVSSRATNENHKSVIDKDLLFGEKDVRRDYSEVERRIVFSVAIKGA